LLSSSTAAGPPGSLVQGSDLELTVFSRVGVRSEIASFFKLLGSDLELTLSARSCDKPDGGGSIPGDLEI
jgi:hypothetical protein